MIASIIITCFMLVMVNMSKIEMIPVEYILPVPFVIEGNSEYWTEFKMCKDPPYKNCNISTRVVIPNIKGNYPLIQVFSANAHQQCTQVAQNDIKRPSIADFLYKGGNLFNVRLINNETSALVGSIVVQINCNPSTQKIGFGNNQELVIPCGEVKSVMKMIYKPLNHITFPTSVGFEDWLQLKIPVCLGDQYSGLHYMGQAIDSYSAASTRACTYTPCNAAANVARDISGSAINSFNILNYNNCTIYFAFEGFGNYGGVNNFLIFIEAI